MEGNNLNFEELVEKINEWADARGISKNSSPLGQARKTQEETCELIEAAAKLDMCWLEDLNNEKYEEEYEDAVGDIIVTLIVGCRTNGTSVLNCLNKAYEVIKDRKGHLRADGVFVKESN